MKNKFHFVALSALVPIILFFGVGLAIAENSGDSTGHVKCKQNLSIEELRAFALNNSPLVAEIDLEYASHLAKAFNAEVLANPEFQIGKTFTRMELDGDNDSQTEVSIGQPLRLSDFGSRGKVAALIRRSGDLQSKAQLLELTQRLTIQLASLHVMQQTGKIISDAEDRATKKIVLIREGVKKGLFSEGEEKLFEGEKYRLQARSRGVASATYALQNELSNSIGSTCLINTADNLKLGDIPPEEVLLAMARGSKFSESARMEILSNLSEEQRRLAELDSFQSITPRIIYQHTNDGGDFIGAGVSFPLPLWNRNQGEKIRTRAEEQLAGKKNNLFANGGFEARVRSLRRAAVSASEQSQLYTSKVIPSFEAALRSQEKLYEEGKGNILQVWQTLRTFNEVQAESLGMWLEALSIRAQLSLLVGEEI